MKSGDKIAYSVQFLRQIGVNSGDIPARRGQFLGHKKVGQRKFAVVQWDDENESHLILEANIAKVGPNIKFCSC